MRVYILPLLSLPLLLAGCVTPGGGLSAGIGSTPGAPGGGAGIVAPGVAGEAIKPLAGEDRRRALAAEFQALEYQPVGSPVEWQGRSGSGEVTALAPFQVGSQNCRQLVHRITVRGQPTVAKGSACREPSGSWTPLS